MTGFGRIVCILHFSVHLLQRIHFPASIVTVWPGAIAFGTRYALFSRSAILSLPLSFLFLWAIRYAGFPRKLLESRPLRKLSEISFSVFLIHWPVIAAFSFRLLLRMANTMSYNRVFVIILAVTTAAVVLLAFVYEMTCGRLADKLAKALQTAVRRRWPVS